MKLKNRFKPEDKIRYWIDHPYCSWREEGGYAICMSNQGCSLHHIDGTESSSIFNSSMLCDVHHKIADGFNSGSAKGVTIRERLRQYTYDRIMELGKPLTEIDTAYLTKHGLI